MLRRVPAVAEMLGNHCCEWIVIVYDYPIFVGNTQLLIVVKYFISMLCRGFGRVS